MSSIPTFPPINETGEPVAETKQKNFSLDEKTITEIREYVTLRENTDRKYSAARLFRDELWPLFQLARRMQAKSKHPGTVFEFAHDAFRLYIDRKV